MPQERLMKNLAGHEVSIFLFRFVLRENGISFVLNELIAKEMYPDIEKQMRPYIHACCETLMRYKHFCNGNVIMDGNILTDGFFEVMLSTGLGQYFVDSEKQNLFKDAGEIAKLLEDVMERRTKEEELGIDPVLYPVNRKLENTQSTNEGLEELGLKLETLIPSDTSNLKRLKPSDLPEGVIARKGYDHRGHCYAFEDSKLGDLGKIVIAPHIRGCRIEADLCKTPSSSLLERKHIFEKVILIIEKALG